MCHVTSVHALDGYRLEVVFSDGTSGTISLQDRLFGPMFEPLRDPSFFKQVRVDDFGAISWPNGADLAPDSLYEQILTAAESVPRGAGKGPFVGRR
jgi:Protein of unknown function (DUF2442)